MRNWKRVKSCQLCGQDRCKENQWMIYCFRYQRAYNKKNFEQHNGIEGKGNIVPFQGLGQSPKEEKRKKVEEKNLFFDDEPSACGH